LRLAARLLLLVVVLTLLTAGALVTLDSLNSSGSRDASDSGEATGAAQDPGSAGEARLTMVPAVAQPGNGPADAARAETVFEARFTPARGNGLVLLERQTPRGWQPVSSAKQDHEGVARLVAPTPVDGAAFRATALTTDGAPGPSSNEVDTSDWVVAFEDDFEGDSLDTNKWMYRQVGLYNENGSRKCSMSDERAVSVSEGALNLQVMQDPERIGEPCYTEHGTLDYYLNGHVATEGIFDFKYGVAAARVKFPQGRGQHGAFWLQRNQEQIPGDPKRSGAEIDVVEFFGEGYPGGGLASFLYYLNSDGENEKVGGVWPKATRQLPPGDAWWRSYHVFSVEWTPKRYVFRVDGREIFRTSEGISGVKQFLILSLLSSDWELPQLDQTTLPTTMEVDWVRVWQRRAGGES
jgi:beta-glucanase (GH16 family)